MRDGRYFLETFGCQMNILDSQLVEGQLRARGLAPTDDYSSADLILFNTCSVRQHAEDKVLSRLGQLKGLKRRRPETIVGVIGCMAEREKEGLFVKAPHVDLLCGPGELNKLSALIDEVRERHERVALLAGSLSRRTEVLQRALEYDSLEALDLSRAPELEAGVLQSYIRVQRGCDQFCTFCVVPFTRGRERGTPPREVLRQVRELAERGYREVVLLGQTVNSYAWEDVTFAQLLRAVARVDGIERIRFTSPYPVDFTDDVIAAIAEEPKICGYVHLPVQSGSDAVLARMRRGYTVDDFRAIVARLRAAVPTIALSTDLLTGFAGETEDDHAATLALMREIRFDSAFMFAYSERDLTFAAKKLPDDVPADTKRRRLAEIVALQERISGEVFGAHVGRRERVLVHGPSRRRATQMMGRTDGFKTVILPDGVGAPGELVDVVIERATMATLFARRDGA